MIGVIGTNHRCADLMMREKIVRAFSACDETFKKDSIFLITCNRAEWYFYTRTPAKIHQEMISFLGHIGGNDMICHLYTFFGLQCFRHLGKVVSGLDSVFLGETEIQGQVKAAYEAARKNSILPKEIHFLFQHALHTGKVVREKIRIPTPTTLCVQVADLVFNHHVQPSSILLIGAGTISRQLATSLKMRGADITIVNHTDQRAHALALDIGCNMLPWTELTSIWSTFPCVIAATRAQEYLLRSSAIHIPAKTQLLIDLGVPRNIDPNLASTRRKIVNIEYFTPSESIEALVGIRSWNDYLCLSKRG